MSEQRPLLFAVIGAGAWGTAIAVHLVRRHQRTTLITRRPEHAMAMQAARENADYLPGVALPDDLAITADLRSGLAGADVVLIASPSQALREWCDRIRASLRGKGELHLLISLVKGLEVSTLLRPSEVMEEVFPGVHVATLTGPTNAAEVASGLPAAMVLASSEPSPFIDEVQAAMSGPTLRLYTSEDLAGAEYGACLKNIYAIAAGLCDGLKLGDNAKAALITRALTEMVRVGETLGARRDTFYGLSGFGDLIATCHGSWSRNREFGEQIGAGRSVQEVLAGRRTVVEGYRTTQALYDLCQKRAISAPILNEVFAILYRGRQPRDALMALMTRELKRETYSPFARK